MSLEKLESCPVCHATSFKSFLTCIDHTTTGESFHVEQCTKCEMVFTNPRPPESEASKYYQSHKYISHTSASTGLTDYIYLIVRRFTLNWKYNLIKKHQRGKKLLDFGAGTGHFVNYCTDKKINAHGVEPSEARGSHHAIKASLDELSENQFDTITLWHVLEHVYQLDQTLEQLKARLINSGTIFIAVPNRESHDAKHYHQNWAAYDVPRHIWHFSKQNMTDLLQRKGLKLIDIVPMKLDAYYVSLLSERYKRQGKLPVSGMISAMITALRSNIKARKNINYSSLIYIATK